MTSGCFNRHINQYLYFTNAESLLATKQLYNLHLNRSEARMASVRFVRHFYQHLYFTSVESFLATKQVYNLHLNRNEARSNSITSFLFKFSAKQL